VNNNRISTFNAASSAFTFSSITGMSTGYPVLCSLGDNLYMLALRAGSFPSLWQFAGGGWGKILDLTSVNQDLNSYNTMWGDPSLNSLVCVFEQNGGGSAKGFAAYQVDFSGGSPVATDRTATMLPAFWRGVNNPGSTVYANSYVDPNTSDPTSPETLVLLGASQTSSRQLYRYTNPTTELTDLGSSDITGEMGVPRRRDACGDYIFTPRTGGLDQDGVTIESFARTDGGVLVTFRAFRNPGSANRTGTLYYRAGRNTPALQATLVAGSVTGGTATNDTFTISSIDADPSITYTVKWNNFADGVPSGDLFNMELLLVRP